LKYKIFIYYVVGKTCTLLRSRYWPMKYIIYSRHTTNEDNADPSAFPTLGSKTANINVKNLPV